MAQIAAPEFAALRWLHLYRTVCGSDTLPISATMPCMKLRTALSLAAGVALSIVAGLTGSAQQSGPELQVGDTAPPFKLQGSDGKTYQLADFKGKSAVVLAWFPKAFTGG